MTALVRAYDPEIHSLPLLLHKVTVLLALTSFTSRLPELYTTGTTTKGKDLKKVNPVLLVIIHDRWSSRPTNPMHNDLLIGPTGSTYLFAIDAPWFP